MPPAGSRARRAPLLACIFSKRLTYILCMSDRNAMIMTTLKGAPIPKKAGRRTDHQRRPARPGKVDPVISAKLAFALRIRAENGKLTGTRTRRVSARVDPGLVEAARIKTGLNNDSELINAALAVIAAPDDFGPWFAAQAGRLPKDFELEL